MNRRTRQIVLYTLASPPRTWRDGAVTDEGDFISDSGFGVTMRSHHPTVRDFWTGKLVWKMYLDASGA